MLQVQYRWMRIQREFGVQGGKRETINKIMKKKKKIVGTVTFGRMGVRF